MSDLTKSSKSKLSSMDMNYTTGNGRAVSGKDFPVSGCEGNLEGMSDMTQNLSVDCGDKTAGRGIDGGFYGHMAIKGLRAVKSKGADLIGRK